MSTVLIAYLSFGLGFYVALAIERIYSFKQASIPAIIRGFLFGVLLWPLAVAFIIYDPGEPIA